MTKDDIMYIEEIAEILDMNPNTIQHKAWREKNGCPLRRVGKRLIAFRAEFEKWMKGCYA